MILVPLVSSSFRQSVFLPSSYTALTRCNFGNADRPQYARTAAFIRHDRVECSRAASSSSSSTGNPRFFLVTGRNGSRMVKKYSYSSQQSDSRIRKEVLSFSTVSDASTIEESETASEDRSAVEVIHCSTCTCEKIHNRSNSSSTQEVEEAIPKWSFYKRILPNTPSLLAFSSEEGKLLFREVLSTSDAANAFFPLSEQFVTQSEPAFCGLTTLAMVLNALSIDPNIRWRGGWRWFDEQVLIHSCCMDMDTVKRVGVTLDQFVSVARCNGAKVFLRRPQATLWTQEEFRNEIRQMTKQTSGFLIVSYSRQTLGQTGDGHFSPIAAYHEERDMALILDVARFKYSPYWVKVNDLYKAMQPVDPATNKPRGWCLVHPQPSTLRGISEQRRPGELVASSSFNATRKKQTGKRNTGDSSSSQHTEAQQQQVFPSKQTTGICPVVEIKVEYCPTKIKDGQAAQR